jgi:RNA-directed DNA polymerase
MSERPPWLRRRRYAHFDQRIRDSEAIRIATSPEEVARHSFFPFLAANLKTYKFVRNGTGIVERRVKHRPIAFASHVDSHIYAYYSSLLQERYESVLAERGLSGVVLAFRSNLNKCNIDFAHNAFQVVKGLAPCTATGLDIKGFFDNLDHKLLKKAWQTLLGTKRLPSDHYKVFRSITSGCVVQLEDALKALGISKGGYRRRQGKRLCSPKEFREKIRKGGLIECQNSGRGIPQGSPISATLSNLYMLDFDESLHSYLNSLGGYYFRYCDDILMVCPEDKSQQCQEFATQKIAELGLTIQDDKTLVVEFDGKGMAKRGRPLQYLGFIYDGRGSRVRAGSTSRYLRKLRTAVRAAKASQAKASKAAAHLGLPPKPLYKSRLRRIYSPWGQRTFLSYLERSVQIMGRDRTLFNQRSVLHGKFMVEWLG